MTGPSAPLLPPLLPRCNTMRQARFERGTFGSGGGTGQRPPTLAVVVSSTYASRASASASQRRLRCYHRCYRGSPLRRCLGAATPCKCIRRSSDGRSPLTLLRIRRGSERLPDVGHGDPGSFDVYHVLESTSATCPTSTSPAERRSPTTWSRQPAKR